MEAIIIGVLYLLAGLAASIFSVMLVLSASGSLLLTWDFLLYLMYKLLTVVPCFLIAYAFLRRKRWGLYLLFSYNGLWIIYVSYAVFVEVITAGTRMKGPVLVAVVLIYFVLVTLVVTAVRLKELK